MGLDMKWPVSDLLLSAKTTVHVNVLPAQSLRRKEDITGSFSGSQGPRL